LTRLFVSQVINTAQWLIVASIESWPPGLSMNWRAGEEHLEPPLRETRRRKLPSPWMCAIVTVTNSEVYPPTVPYSLKIWHFIFGLNISRNNSHNKRLPTRIISPFNEGQKVKHHRTYPGINWWNSKREMKVQLQISSDLVRRVTQNDNCFNLLILADSFWLRFSASFGELVQAVVSFQNVPESLTLTQLFLPKQQCIRSLSYIKFKSKHSKCTPQIIRNICLRQCVNRILNQSHG
jgi:hypothetical protein